MRIIDIPRHAWTEQVNAFTAVHEGRLVSLDVDGSAGTQHQIDDLPLLGISTDRAHDDGTITVSIARGRDHFSHTIPGVSRIYLQTSDDGAAAALVFESAGGVKTRLRVRSAVLPASVDAMATR
jgi:hypothetical protein